MQEIDLNGQPLDLALTLTCGQAFRWHQREDGIWSGVVRDKLIELDMRDGMLLWRTYPSDDEPLVRDYLRLADDVTCIYHTLAEMDPHLGELAQRFSGLRLLRQDPTETLLTFICSAANSIPRITAGVAALSVKYGDLVCETEGSCYFTFPHLARLAEADPTELATTESLGFRGPNLKSVAEQVLERGEGWLMSLRGMTYSDAKQMLLEIKGVGQKIADCVCLFSLDKDEAVPVDTHVRQLAQKFFMPDMQAKTITDAVYRRVMEAFEERYGRYAGWAQHLLFYEDLMRTRALGRGLK
ncbi:MAG: DNA glycosylase [Armatimonadota bacterium]|nr:hypothetical protein [bacterium]